MALTLLEAAKYERRLDRQALIEIFAGASDLLRVMPFETIEGMAYTYNQESLLPGIAFRAINGAYAESTGVINPESDPLKAAGGDVDVDKFFVKTLGEGTRESQETMKIKKLASYVGYKVVKGDSETSNVEFNGLQARLTGNQLIDAGASSGGDALSLSKLDELLDAVDDPTHLLMSKASRRTLKAAARNTSISGHITYEPDEFGRSIMKYDDLPILIGDANDNDDPALAYDEANPGGGSSVGTSIYCLSLGEGKLFGIQNSTPDIADLGELQTKPTMRSRVEWFNGMVLEHPRAAARLQGIKSAAVVA